MKRAHSAQIIVEFTFCMIIIFIMIYSTIKVFQWVGVDMVHRRVGHEKTLTSGDDSNPEVQTKADFYKATNFNATVQY
ncbi:MAG: hypothetical protein HQL24_09655 [Candidatus Omnitrophica bacterium]|nr:hypothetical protein [Candidatus Omnitrophota bacterium]